MYDDCAEIFLLLSAVVSYLHSAFWKSMYKFHVLFFSFYTSSFFFARNNEDSAYVVTDLSSSGVYGSCTTFFAVVVTVAYL